MITRYFSISEKSITLLKMLDFRGKGYLLGAATGIKSKTFHTLFWNFSESYASVQ